MIDNGLSSDICGTAQVQTKFLNRQNNNGEVQEDDNPKEEQTESRAQNEKKKHVFELLKNV